ncbi:MAG TPA: hypothetical protein VER03_15410 [Bryobacteraceae bacterium]|nr:hypothetical protein [Bryobacteraceae bacterium]
MSFAQTRIMGEVSGKTADGITVQTDAGQSVNVPVTRETRVLRVPPGETSLSKAATIAVGEVQPGDRVLVRTNQIIVMSRSELDQKRASERAAWQARGISGKVTEVAGDSLTMATSSGQTLKVTTSPKTVFRRYAPDSVKFSDAKASVFVEIRTGDQVRVLGERSGDAVSADTIVSGTFRNFAGTVVSVNTAAGEITLTDLETKKPVTVRVGADATTRRLPPQMAEMLAQRRGGSDNGTSPHASRTTAPGDAPVGERGRSAEAQAAGRGAGGGARDLGQMLERMPPLTLTELKPGDALIVASTTGKDESRATAISVLAGVEPLLTGPPSDRRLSGPWSLDINMAQ